MNVFSQLILALLCAPFAAALMKEDSRMMAYLGNWQSCPSNAQLDQYTHIAIGFAVSYTFASPKNQCSETCFIDVPPICGNQPNPTLVREWKERGIKVLLSFGGAGMGGSWDGDVNDCWDFCFGREDYVIDRLVELVNMMNLDGVDIDYEYFLEDNPERGFMKGAEAINFLEKITVGFRERMPDKILTHAPMDADLIEGEEYFELLKRIGHTLDFIMPQYYNGITRPNLDGFTSQAAGQMSPLDHYNGLLEVFDNDPTRIVFGFCINDCGGTNSNAAALQAADVISQLGDEYSCHGGAFFWVNEHDLNADWSREVNRAQSVNRGCSVPAGAIPAAPTSTPVSSPVASFPSPTPPITIPVPPISSSIPPLASPVPPSEGQPPSVSSPTLPVSSPPPFETSPTAQETNPPASETPLTAPPVTSPATNGTTPDEPNFWDPNNSRSTAFAVSLAPFVPILVTIIFTAL